jgi:hypothetical protein
MPLWSQLSPPQFISVGFQFQCRRIGREGPQVAQSAPRFSPIRLGPKIVMPAWYGATAAAWNTQPELQFGIMQRFIEAVCRK